mmetsp:Transcript_139268/g.445194  ORF Transcript_139268/g.445194 Transcript_139268/m.445194 type:complete len:209 (-) Transcript_139268:2316-2942(-)
MATCSTGGALQAVHRLWRSRFEPLPRLWLGALHRARQAHASVLGRASADVRQGCARYHQDVPEMCRLRPEAGHRAVRRARSGRAELSQCPRRDHGQPLPCLRPRRHEARARGGGRLRRLWPRGVHRSPAHAWDFASPLPCVRPDIVRGLLVWHGDLHGQGHLPAQGLAPAVRLRGGCQSLQGLPALREGQGRGAGGRGEVGQDRHEVG